MEETLNTFEIICFLDQTQAFRAKHLHFSISNPEVPHRNQQAQGRHTYFSVYSDNQIEIIRLPIRHGAEPLLVAISVLLALPILKGTHLRYLKEHLGNNVFMS